MTARKDDAAAGSFSRTDSRLTKAGSVTSESAYEAIAAAAAVMSLCQC